MFIILLYLFVNILVCFGCYSDFVYLLFSAALFLADFVPKEKYVFFDSREVSLPTLFNRLLTTCHLFVLVWQMNKSL